MRCILHYQLILYTFRKLKNDANIKSKRFMIRATLILCMRKIRMNKTGPQMSLEVCSHGFERSITLSMHFRSLCAKRFSHVLSSSVLEGKRFQRRPLCLCIGINSKGLWFSCINYFWFYWHLIIPYSILFTLNLFGAHMYMTLNPIYLLSIHVYFVIKRQIIWKRQTRLNALLIHFISIFEENAF